MVFRLDRNIGLNHSNSYRGQTCEAGRVIKVGSAFVDRLTSRRSLSFEESCVCWSTRACRVSIKSLSLATAAFNAFSCSDFISFETRSTSAARVTAASEAARLSLSAISRLALRD